MNAFVRRAGTVVLAAFMAFAGLQPAAIAQANSPTPTATADGPVTYTFGYAYPGLWLLPLVLLVMVPLVARALTKNLEPEAPR